MSHDTNNQVISAVNRYEIEEPFLPLASAREALDYPKDGHPKGKVVIAVKPSKALSGNKRKIERLKNHVEE